MTWQVVHSLFSHDLLISMFAIHEIFKALANLANMLARFPRIYFSKQKATNILGFSFIRLLTFYQ